MNEFLILSFGTNKGGKLEKPSAPLRQQFARKENWKMKENQSIAHSLP